MQRAAAIKAAMTELSKIKANRQIKDGLRQRNGPYILQIHDTTIGSNVLVWRVHINKWTGPHKLLIIKDGKCTVELPNGSQDFRSTIVKVLNEQTLHDINC